VAQGELEIRLQRELPPWRQRLDHGKQVAGRGAVVDGLEDQPPRRPPAGRQVEMAATQREGLNQAEDLVVAQRLGGRGHLHH
jgi:hypothetical protein